MKFIPAQSDPDGSEVVRNAVLDARPVVEDMWGFGRPRRLKVIVWTDWMDGYEKGLTWSQRRLLPLFRKRLSAMGERLWPVIGGMTLRGSAPAVLVKPPKKLDEADVRIGEQLFVKLESIELKVRATACHELTHAYATGRAMPWWLNEGIAMVTVDRFCGHPTVKAQTIEMLGSVGRPRRAYSRLAQLTDSELVKLYARGYWITRFLLEEHPAVLRKLLRRRLWIGVNERLIANAVGVPRARLWQDIDGIVFDHYRG